MKKLLLVLLVCSQAPAFAGSIATPELDAGTMSMVASGITAAFVMYQMAKLRRRK